MINLVCLRNIAGQHLLAEVLRKLNANDQGLKNIVDGTRQIAEKPD